MGVRYRFDSYLLDVAAHELRRDGELVPLPARSFECLCCLIEARDRAVGRDELVQAVFGRVDVSDAQLAQIVLRTRRAIGDDGQEQRAIRTVPRFGFRWVAPVEVLAADAPDPASIPAPASVAPPDATPASAVIDASAPPAPATAASPAASSWRRGRRMFAIATMLLVLAIAAAAAWWWSARREAATPPNVAAAGAPRAVVVLPVAVDAGADASWARLGLMDFVADRLRRGGLPVPSSEGVLGIVHAQSGATGKPDPVRLRRATRAAWLVDGDAKRSGDGWEVTLQARHADGSVQRGQARARDLLEAARLATDRLSPALGGQLPADENGMPALAERLQRARVAMLANEVDAARRILLDAPELQREQPRLRYQLARVDFRAGEFERGLATLDALRADENVRRDRTFLAQVLNARGAMLVRLDRLDEAQRSYDEVIALADDGRHPTELGIALSGRAVTDAMRQEFGRALDGFARARAQLEAAGDALAVARVDANVGTLEVDRGRPAAGMPFLDGAIDSFAAMGAVNELATVRNVRTLAHLQLLKTDAAIADSDRNWALMPRLRDSTQRADVVLARADVMIARGRLREAARLLALPEAGQALTAEAGRRELLQVELALQHGDGARAAALADAALRTWPRDRNPRLRAWLQLRREQAAPGGDRAPADTAVPADALLPARLARAVAQGAQDEADADYRAALMLAERRGIPTEQVAAAVAYGGWLLDRERVAEAAGVLGRVAPWADADYELALMQVRLARARGQRDVWRSAWQRAAALAGERQLPKALAPPAP
jgi:DNA-binding winged helix-turn-helix (wHTH) protein/tetratricopeptide (TPR) repeat protein